MRKTLEQIRQEGLEALRDRLGQGGMLQFLSLFEVGQGNYVRDRRAWADATSLDDLQQAVKKPAAKRNPKRRPKPA
jgi:hypothetical protein